MTSSPTHLLNEKSIKLKLIQMISNYEIKDDYDLLYMCDECKAYVNMLYDEEIEKDRVKHSEFYSENPWIPMSERW